MKERPILFQGAMVRALLAGAKTQTRRVVKWRDLEPGLNLQFTGLQAFSYVPGMFTLEAPTRIGWERRSGPTRCPYGQPGDRLWVRESWAYNPDFPGIASRACFMADPEHKYDGLKWKPSIHMPRAVCRTVLEITGVRVERLQAISEADALAEGIVQLRDLGYGLPEGEFYHAADPCQSYYALFESINGPGSVQANPWLWVVDFKRTETSHA